MIRPLLLLLTCLFVSVGGCSAPPFAAATNLQLTEAEKSERRVLSRAEQREALAAMRLVAEGHAPSGQPATVAKQGMRWADVPLALRYACEEVDMAVVRTIRNDEHKCVFLLITLDERPAKLTVRRINDAQVYEASATVGRFGDDSERASQLVDALHRNMHALGQKRAFD